MEETKMMGYYFITDSKLSRHGDVHDVLAAVKCGVPIVQYRDKGASTKQMYDKAIELREICYKTKTRFIVNDRLDIALAVDADGVHLGQDDMPLDVARKMLGKKKLIGVTVHSVEEAVAAEKHGAGYLGVSPIFSTATKSDAGKAVGVGLIRQIKQKCGVPIVAIGGITLANAPDVVRAGADMVAAISAVVTKDDVEREIAKFQKLYH